MNSPLAALAAALLSWMLAVPDEVATQGGAPAGGGSNEPTGPTAGGTPGDFVAGGDDGVGAIERPRGLVGDKGNRPAPPKVDGPTSGEPAEPNGSVPPSPKGPVVGGLDPARGPRLVPLLAVDGVDRGGLLLEGAQPGAEVVLVVTTRDGSGRGLLIGGLVADANGTLVLPGRLLAGRGERLLIRAWVRDDQGLQATGALIQRKS